jgi:ribosomal protein L7/L12
MTDQQERMAKEILTTIRSIQNTNNSALVNIVGRITEEIFQPDGKYRVVMDSHVNAAGSCKKIHAIKILREYSGMGLKDAKDIVDQMDGSRAIVFLDNVPHDIAIAAVNSLREVELVGKIEKI